MIRVRKAQDRGHANHGWLKTYHTFSFATYQDRQQMRFRSLRVMNEDFVAPGQGFGTHPHHDMEIVTYVLEGALEHRDSMGNGAVLRPGEFQRMSAGTGITHSEFNPSPTEPVHLYQIWLLPAQKGMTPSYEQKGFPAEERLNRLRLVASSDAEEGSLRIHQDARIYLATLEPDAAVTYHVRESRGAWLQVLRGSVTLNTQPLNTQPLNTQPFNTQSLESILLEAGDGAAVDDEHTLTIRAAKDAEIMLFDLA